MKDLKSKLRSGKPVIGLFLASGCTAVAEIAAGCGYDFVIVDGEHGQGDERSWFDQIARLEKYETAVLVRIPAFRREYVQRVLDYGCDGVLAPMMETEEQAREFAASMRYAPKGTRGMTGIFRASDYNREIDSYLETADEKLLCAVQIESAAGVDNVEKIAATEGIDLLFIGHSDLSMDYGCYKQFSDPRVRTAEKRIIEAASKHGKFTGMVLRPGMDLKQYSASGVNFICTGTDLGLMQTAFRESLKTASDQK